MSPTIPSDDLLLRYLERNCTSAEAADVEAWLDRNPAGALVFAALQSDTNEGSRDEVEVTWSAIAHRTDMTARTTVADTGRDLSSRSQVGKKWAPMNYDGRRPSVPNGRHSRTVLGAIFGMFIAVLSYSAWHRQNGAGVAPSVTTYATTPGERKTIAFRDGSRIVLGPATRLTLSSSDESGGMAAEVAGEALFTVTHVATRPFIVRTTNSSIRVLGTTFVVRRYASDAQTRIVVTEGRVTIGPRNARAGAQLAPLGANMRASMDDSGTVQVVPTNDTRQYTDWAAGTLIFHDTPVRDVVADLTRAYGITIQLADSTLAGRQVTWTCHTTRYSLGDALSDLSTILGVRVKRTEQGITLVPGQRPSPRPALPRHSFTTERSYGL